MLKKKHIPITEKDFKQIEENLLKEDRETFYYDFRVACSDLAIVDDYFKDMSRCEFSKRKEIVSKYMAQDVNENLKVNNQNVDKHDVFISDIKGNAEEDVNENLKVNNQNVDKHDVFISDIKGNAEEILRILKINGVITEATYNENTSKIDLTLNENFRGRIFFTGNLTVSGKKDPDGEEDLYTFPKFNVIPDGEKDPDTFPSECNVIATELLSELRNKIKQHNDTLKADQDKSLQDKINEWILLTGVPGNHEFVDGCSDYALKACRENNDYEVVEGDKISSDFVQFVKSRIMAIKVFAEMQMDYLQYCKFKGIKKIVDKDLQRLKISDEDNEIDVDEKIDLLEGLASSMDKILKDQKLLKEAIVEIACKNGIEKFVRDEDELDRRPWKARSYSRIFQYKNDKGKECYCGLFNEIRQLFWKDSVLLHTLVIDNDDDDKTQIRLMHNPVFLLDKETCKYYKDVNWEVEAVADHSSKEWKGLSARMQSCLKNNKITIPGCLISPDLIISHRLPKSMRKLLFSDLYAQNPTFFGHENLQITKETVLTEFTDHCKAGGVCVDRQMDQGHGLKKWSSLIVSQDVGNLIKVEQYEAYSIPPRRIGVVYLCKDGTKQEQKEKAKKLNDQISSIIENIGGCRVKQPETVSTVNSAIADMLVLNPNKVKFQRNAKTFEQKQAAAFCLKRIYNPLKKISDNINKYYKEKKIIKFNKEIAKIPGINDSSILDNNLQPTVQPKQILNDIETFYKDCKNNLELFQSNLGNVSDSMYDGMFCYEFSKYFNNLEKQIQNLRNDLTEEQAQFEKEHKQNNINNNNNTTNNNIDANNDNNMNNDANSTSGHGKPVSNNNIGSIKQKTDIKKQVSQDKTELETATMPAQQLFNEITTSENFSSLHIHWNFFRSMINDLIVGNEHTRNGQTYIVSIDNYFKSCSSVSDIDKSLESFLLQGGTDLNTLLQRLCNVYCMFFVKYSNLNNNRLIMNTCQDIDDYFTNLKKGDFGSRLYFSNNSKRKYKVGRYFDNQKLRFSDINMEIEQNTNSISLANSNNIRSYNQPINNMHKQVNNNRYNQNVDILNINDINWYDGLRCSCN